MSMLHDVDVKAPEDGCADKVIDANDTFLPLSMERWRPLSV